MKINIKKGFTLIELIIVIVLLGLLAAAALPKFSDLEEEARDAAEQGVVGAFREAIGIAHGTWLAKGKPTDSIELEGTNVWMHSTAGYPRDTASGGTDAMSVTRCTNVYNGILNGPPPAGTCTSASDESTCAVDAALNDADTTTCKYTFVHGTDENFFTYQVTTGQIAYIQN